MVSSTLIKLSSPVAKSCLFALSVAILIDAILTVYAGNQYPYLVDYNYIDSSRTIAIVYSGIALAATLLAISTAIAAYRDATSYVLVHAGITGVYLPVLILVYFNTRTARYKVTDYVDDYREWIHQFRVDDLPRRSDDQAHKLHQDSDSHDSISSPKITLKSFINTIDSLQTKFSCCGVESAQDWIDKWNGYIAPSCCNDRSVTTNETWAKQFDVESNQEFRFCAKENSHHLGCLTALKEDELSKFAWLSDLIVFMIVITITNTIVSLLLFGLNKTEDSQFQGTEESELSIIGVSSRPRPSQPTITSIKHRPSVIHNLGASQESINARVQAVKFNISNTPRVSISGPSKFSAAARRGSSFI